MNASKPMPKITSFFQVHNHRKVLSSKCHATEANVLKSAKEDDENIRNDIGENCNSWRKTGNEAKKPRLEHIEDCKTFHKTDKVTSPIAIEVLLHHSTALWRPSEKVAVSEEKVPVPIRSKTILVQRNHIPQLVKVTSNNNNQSFSKEDLIKKACTPSNKGVLKKKCPPQVHRGKIAEQVRKILEEIGEGAVRERYCPGEAVDAVSGETARTGGVNDNTQQLMQRSSSQSIDASIEAAIAGGGTRQCTTVGRGREATSSGRDHTARVSHGPTVKAEMSSPMLANIGPTWYKVLKDQLSMPYFMKLMEYVNSERCKHEVYPPPHQVFTWTMKCPVSQVKVVILGQDPYHNPHQAHGLAFSVQKGVHPPPSLQNMYKELVNDVPGFSPPNHGDLSGWATQGVLLLNAVLTVRAHQANSHKEQGWELFTDAAVEWLGANCSGLVFMLWGGAAQRKGGRIDTSRHCVLTSAHPSPLSAYKGFFHNGHFSKANDYLRSHGKAPINWNYLP